MKAGQWNQFDIGDQQFLGYGDSIKYDGGKVGEVREVVDDLVAIENEDGDREVVDVFDIDEFKREADDVEDVRAELMKNSSNRGLSYGNDVVSWYTDDSEYRKVQSHMRGAREVAMESPFFDHAPSEETQGAILATTDKKTADKIVSLQNAASGTLNMTLTVYRGLNVDVPSFLDHASELMVSGDRLSDAGFQSTTIRRGVAESFGNVVLEITTSTGAYLRAASEFAGEDEVLLPAGTQYEITDVDYETNTIHAVQHGGFKFNIDVDFIRDEMEKEGIGYGEAIERVV